jgi:hypothetical protein
VVDCIDEAAFREFIVLGVVVDCFAERIAKAMAQAPSRFMTFVFTHDHCVAVGAIGIETIGVVRSVQEFGPGTNRSALGSRRKVANGVVEIADACAVAALGHEAPFWAFILPALLARNNESCLVHAGAGLLGSLNAHLLLKDQAVVGRNAAIV